MTEPGVTPQSLNIAAFIFGAILLLVGLIGGGFKLFGAEIPGGVSPKVRGIALLFGLVLIVSAVLLESMGPPHAKSSTTDTPNQSEARTTVPQPDNDKLIFATGEDVFLHETNLTLSFLFTSHTAKSQVAVLLATLG